MKSDYYLYIDTSEAVSLGLLVEKQWKVFETMEGQKSSQVLHAKIAAILAQEKIEILNLAAVFLCAGPGSYTGMRLGEGFAQILEWQGVDVYSFYHYQVPQIYGASQGLWLASAFKGELFYHHWHEQEQKNGTLPLSEQDQFLSRFQCDLYARSSELDFVTGPLTSTHQLIRQNPVNLCDHLLTQRPRFGPYYYRPLNQEFKVADKLS